MKKIFSKMWDLDGSSQNETQTKSPLSQNTSIPFIADDNKQENETYHTYGLRICGRVTGSIPALTPYLRKIYNNEKQQQYQDKATQERLRHQLQQEINEVECDISRKETQKSGLNVRLDDIEDKIADTQKDLNQAKAQDGEVNKMARVKLVIGSLILALLTIYLFIFYSSTFYSAFLYQPDPDSHLSVGNAMLNARAYSEAAQMGFGSLVFIITAPIIFLGLGYSLHYFMIQKGNIKWFKICALLFVTLTFDCILAYKIGEVIYNIWASQQWESQPPFTMGMAIRDINFWSVIFCGFIVYLIWGIVFDMIMTAYEDLRSNKHQINQLNLQLDGYKVQKNQIKQDIVSIDGEINSLLSQKNGLNHRLNNSVLVDYTRIRNALSDFFAGWVNMMSGLGHSTQAQDEARRIYENTITQLFV
ncbi:MAG: hypothetical protein J1F20_02070 [Muribaculaceae bacterium]|nr:hypothetical protein [Muribaculaceae bacterium]